MVQEQVYRRLLERRPSPTVVKGLQRTRRDGVVLSTDTESSWPDDPGEGSPNHSSPTTQYFARGSLRGLQVGERGRKLRIDEISTLKQLTLGTKKRTTGIPTLSPPTDLHERRKEGSKYLNKWVTVDYTLELSKLRVSPSRPRVTPSGTWDLSRSGPKLRTETVTEGPITTPSVK